MRVKIKVVSEVLYQKDVLKNFAIFTGKRFGWSLFFNIVEDLQTCNFVKKRLQHRYFSVDIVKFIRTPILKKICEWLHLTRATFRSSSLEPLSQTCVHREVHRKAPVPESL